MSGAAVMAPRPQAPAGVFRGDGEGLVEALIAACERKPVARTAIPELFGRELVPWTDDGSAGAPLGQPLEGAARRAQPKFPTSSHKHARPAPSCGRAPDSPEARKACGAAKRSKVGGASPPRSASPQAMPAAAPFACPAVAASPKPEHLPMPTTDLMSRALVRGRSPSPPKDGCFALAPLHSVRVAAA